MSIQLGPFNIEHPFILAPMAGITNSPYRRLMRRMKSSMVISELVSANGIEHMGDKSLELLKFHEEEQILGLQTLLTGLWVRRRLWLGRARWAVWP